MTSSSSVPWECLSFLLTGNSICCMLCVCVCVFNLSSFVFCEKTEAHANQCPTGQLIGSVVKQIGKYSLIGSALML